MYIYIYIKTISIYLFLMTLNMSNSFEVYTRSGIYRCDIRVLESLADSNPNNRSHHFGVEMYRIDDNVCTHLAVPR
jgi:hypothetical protein